MGTAFNTLQHAKNYHSTAGRTARREPSEGVRRRSVDSDFDLASALNTATLEGAVEQLSARGKRSADARTASTERDPSPRTDSRPTVLSAEGSRLWRTRKDSFSRV